MRDTHEPAVIMQNIMLVACGIVITIAGVVFGLISLLSKNRTWGSASLSGVTTIANGVLLAVLIAQGVYFVPKFGKTVMEDVKAKNQSSKERVSVATRVIPRASSSTSENSVRELLDRWADQNLRTAYDTHGKRNPEWDQDVHEMIDASFPRWFQWPRHDDPTSKVTPGNRRTIGKKLLAAGCDDPLFFLLEGMMEFGPKREELLKKAVDGLPGCGYPRSLLFIAQAYLLQPRLSGKKQPAPEELSACLKSLEAALKEKPLGEADYWFWDIQLNRGAGFDLLKTQGSAMCATIDAVPQVAEWFKHRMRGAVEIQQGWQANGHMTSSPLAIIQQTRDFRMHFGRAREQLESAWKLAPLQPSVSAEMIITTGGLGEIEEMRTWFDRSVSGCFDYWPAYENMKWGLNDKAAKLAFAMACAQTKRFDTWVPWTLVTTCQERSIDENDAIFGDPELWDTLHEVVEGYEKSSKGDQFRTYYQSEIAIIAEKFRQFDVCWQQLSGLKFKLNHQAASEWHVPEDAWIKRTSAETGAAREKVLPAEMEDNDYDQDRALADYRAAYESLKNQSTDPAGTFVLQRIRKLEQQNALQSSSWRPFMPTENLAGWRTVKGIWTVSADSAVAGKNNPDAKPQNDDDDDEESDDTDAVLVNDQIVGPVFEITGEFDTTARKDGILEAGFVFGVYEKHDVQQTIQFFRGEKKDGVYVGDPADDGNFTKCAPFPDHNIFDIQVTEQSIIVSINGRKAVHENFANWTFTHPANVQIGFCSSSGDKSLRFKNVKVRTPSGTPPPSGNKAEPENTPEISKPDLTTAPK